MPTEFYVSFLFLKQSEIIRAGLNLTTLWMEYNLHSCQVLDYSYLPLAFETRWTGVVFTKVEKEIK